MKLQDFNYHTHTYRCGHAIGSEEDMIEAAIAAGFKTIGISEHIGFEDWGDNSTRMPFDQMDDYLATMNTMKEKYKGKIKVLIGFEVEYFPDLLDYYKKYRAQCDYMILAQHATGRANKYYIDIDPSDENLLKMADLAVEAMGTGLFDMMAHPDYFMWAKNTFDDTCAEVIRKIAIAAKKHNIPLELNMKGYLAPKRSIDGVMSQPYPLIQTFKIVSEIGAKTFIGYDAHEPIALSYRDVELEILKKFSPLGLDILREEFIK